MGLIWSQTKVANYTLKKYCPLMKSTDIFKVLGPSLKLGPLR